MSHRGTGEKVRCRVCGHVGPGRVPKGGDGSMVVPHPHIRKDHGIYAVACPGQYEEALPDETAAKFRRWQMDTTRTNLKSRRGT